MVRLDSNPGPSAPDPDALTSLLKENNKVGRRKNREGYLQRRKMWGLHYMIVRVEEYENSDTKTKRNRLGLQTKKQPV